MKNSRINKNIFSVLKIDMGRHGSSLWSQVKNNFVLEVKEVRPIIGFALRNFYFMPFECQGQKECADCIPIFLEVQTLLEHITRTYLLMTSWKSGLKKRTKCGHADTIPFFLHSIVASPAFKKYVNCHLFGGGPGFRGVTVNLFPILIPYSACFQ